MEKDLDKSTSHNCEAPNNNKTSGYGAAVESCREDKDGLLWVDNDEYANVVSYCPFCGYKAKKIKM